MAIFSKHLFAFMENATAAFRDGPDVQTIAVALAISVSMLCSLVLLVANLITRLSSSGGDTSQSCRMDGRRIHHGYKKSQQRSPSSKLRSYSFTNAQPSDKPHKQGTLCARCDVVCTCHISRNLVNLSMRTCAEINLSNHGLSVCPARIGYSGPQVSALYLSHNALVSLPEEIGCLQGLTRLELSYNAITHLPECLGNLAALRELNVTHNQLKTLPDSCVRLQGLTELQLSHNQLETCPAVVPSLGSLNVLVLSNNKLKSLPSKLCNLRNLCQLDVSHNPLTSLPDNVDRLIRLHVLSASSCQLSTIPAALASCVCLASIDLSHNRLTRLPAGMGRLHQLSELSVHGNKLRYLPMSMYTFLVQTDVKKLTVYDNCFLDIKDQEVFLRRNQSVISTTTPDKRHIPSLQVYSARSILANKINWESENISQVLKDLLTGVRYCDTCDVPMFEAYQQQLLFAMFAERMLPFYENTCSLHSITMGKCTPSVTSQ